MSQSKPALRLGIGGPVGSGKTALVRSLCLALRERFNLAVITIAFSMRLCLIFGFCS